MFCPNCGIECGEVNFCAGCGFDLRELREEATEAPDAEAPGEAAQEQAEPDWDGGPRQEYPPLKEPLVCNVNGVRVDLNRLIRAYGMGARKSGAYYYLSTHCGISVKQAKGLLLPIIEQHKTNKEKISFGESLLADLNKGAEQVADEAKAEKKRLQELERNGQVYCPKCHSVSVTAEKKGFGVGKGALGLMLVGPKTGVVAGAMGSKKMVCTCLKCGYQWKPGKE